MSLSLWRKVLPLYQRVSRSFVTDLRSAYFKSLIVNDSHGNLKLLIPTCARCYCAQAQENQIQVVQTEVDQSQVGLVKQVDRDELYRKIVLEVKGHDEAVLKSYTLFVLTAADELNVKVGKITKPPKKIDRWSLLKSPHIFKKSWSQYEARTHFKTIELKYLTGSTASVYLEYIERNLPEGIAMKVTKHRLESLPDHLFEEET